MDFSESKRTRAIICLTLAIATIAVYWRVANFDFVNYDDPDYVTQNDMVKSGLSANGIFWAFTHFYASNWHPLTWLSHMVDCQLFGLHAGAHHLVNVAFHIANVVLLFLLLEQLTGARWRSAMVAALFALHPLHVESVAWVAERKDVLSTALGLLALHAYMRYVAESKTQSPRAKAWFLRTIILFALALLAKPMLVTLPFLMLLLDFWPLQRIENTGWRTFFSLDFGRLVREKWALFSLAAASSLVTFFAQKAAGSVLSTEKFTFSLRVENAVTAYLAYTMKAIWPAHLAVFYPLVYQQPAARLALAICFLVVITLLALATVRRWPFFLVGWLWYLGTLIPVIGLVQVGIQAMADRYTYMPLTGLFIIVVWGAAEWLGQGTAIQLSRTIVGAAMLAALALASSLQLQYWKNSLALFHRDIAVVGENALADNDIGTALAAINQKPEAMTYYQKAVSLQPGNAKFQNNLATALARAGQANAALEHYLDAINDNPRYAEAYSNLGALYLAQHRIGDAITNLHEAVLIDPENGETRSNFGNALAAAGKLDEAIQQYIKAVRLTPSNATIRVNLGLALLKAGNASDAMNQFAEAVRLDPDSAEARYQLGQQLFLHGQFPAAAEQLGESFKLKPQFAASGFYLAAAQAEMGRFDDAVSTSNRALQSALHAGQTNLAVRIQTVMEFYKSHRLPTAKGN